MIVPASELRTYMLAAYDQGMVSGDYVFFEISNLADAGWTSWTETWAAGDDARDQQARKAAENLMIVSCGTIYYWSSKQIDRNRFFGLLLNKKVKTLGQTTIPSQKIGNDLIWFCSLFSSKKSYVKFPESVWWAGSSQRATHKDLHLEGHTFVLWCETLKMATKKEGKWTSNTFTDWEGCLLIFALSPLLNQIQSLKGGHILVLVQFAALLQSRSKSINF